MRRIAGKALSLAAVSALLVAQPALAATRSADSLPAVSAQVNVDGQRSSTGLGESEQVRGGFVIPVIAIIAILLGILAATGGDNDRPVSPG